MKFDIQPTTNEKIFMTIAVVLIAGIITHQCKQTNN